MAPRAITEEEKQIIQQLVARARVALKLIADYDQARVDRLIQAVCWALSNEKTFTRKIKEIILALRLEQKFSKDEENINSK